MKHMLFYIYCFFCGICLAVLIESFMEDPQDITNIILSVGMIALGVWLFKKIARSALVESKHINANTNLVDAKMPIRTGLPGNSDKIIRYMEINKSTDYFRTNLLKLSELILSVDKKLTSTDSILRERFKDDKLVFQQYETMLKLVSDHLIEISSRAIIKMEHFDEEIYEKQITTLKEANKETEADAYIRIENDYKKFLEQVIDAFMNAYLKLDSLILEEVHLSNTDSNVILESLDQLIDTTKLYNLNK